MSAHEELPAEQQARLRQRLQARLDAGEWADAEQALHAWLSQFGFHPWMLEQRGHLQVRRAAWFEAGESFFWAGVRGPEVERAIGVYLRAPRDSVGPFPDRAPPRWAMGAFDRLPEVVKQDLAAMGIARERFEPKPRVKSKDSLLATIGLGAGILFVAGSMLYTVASLVRWLFGD